MTCAIYIRVSTETQAEKGHSLDAQEKEGIRICKQNGWDYQIFREAGKSAYKDTLDNRPEIQKILDLADEGKIEYCFVTELDRLSRNPITLAFIKNVFSENNVKVVTLGQTFDFKDDDDDFMTDLLGLLAKRENRLRVKRSKRGMLESVLKGGWQGGATPFGYKRENKKIAIDPEESKTYSMMVSWSLEGKGTNTIARLLNDMDIVTKGTKEWRRLNKSFKWKAGVVLRILKNPLYKGEFIYKGQNVKVPALISKEKWDSIQENLKRNYRTGNTKRFYLLKGLLYCKKCGRRLFGKIKLSSHERLYCCLSKRPDPEPRFCGLRSVNLDKINKLVWEKTREIAFNSSKLKEVIENKEAEHFIDDVEMGVQLSQLERLIEGKDNEIKDIIRRKSLYKSVTDEDIDKTISEIKSEQNDLILQKVELEKKISNTRRAKEQAKYISDYLKTIAYNIDSFTDEEKYEFLHLLIQKIEIDWDGISREHKTDIIYTIPVEEKLFDENPLLCHSDGCGYSRVGGKHNTNKFIELRISATIPQSYIFPKLPGKDIPKSP